MTRFMLAKIKVNTSDRASNLKLVLVLVNTAVTVFHHYRYIVFQANVYDDDSRATESRRSTTPTKPLFFFFVVVFGIGIGIGVIGA